MLRVKPYHQATARFSHKPDLLAPGSQGRSFGHNKSEHTMKLQKTLCTLGRKHIEDTIDYLSEIVGKPKYLCRKCARAANKKKYLCKPAKLKRK
jgi:hypothetical protein